MAVVDLVTLFNDFEQTKVLNQKMSDLEQQLSDEDRTRSAKVDTLANALKGFVPDSADYKKRSDELFEEKVRYQVWKSSKQDELARAHLRWVNRTYEKVEKEVAAAAKAKGFQIVITKEELDKTVDDSKVMLKQIIGAKSFTSSRQWI